MRAGANVQAVADAEAAHDPDQQCSVAVVVVQLLLVALRELTPLHEADVLNRNHMT